MSESNRLIFVGGCARSGTTLLQNMLDSHPDILGGPEFLHLVEIIALRKTLLGSVKKGWIDLFCSAEDVDTHIRRLIERLLLPFVDKYGSKMMSEKSPENVLVMSELLELFPASKLIYIVRDPRAIIASLLVAGKRARAKGEKPAPYAADLQSALAYTQRRLNAGFKAAANAPDKIHTVLYEQLVRNPDDEARKLCEFLDLPWSKAMLHPGEKKHLGEAAITVNSNEVWYDVNSYNSNPNSDSLDKWRHDLRHYEQIIVNQAFLRSKPLCSLGYDFSNSSMALLPRLINAPIALLTRVRWRLVRRFRQAFEI